MVDSTEYQTKKAFFAKVITVYGRNAVAEALADQTLACHALHLANSNKPSQAIDKLTALAKKRNISIHYHERAALSRLSKNARQDQGVCADIICPDFQTIDTFNTTVTDHPMRLLALDGITNPQNLGMILRSATAGLIDGILLAKKGNAALGPLVIKASAGAAYRAPLIHCDSLPNALKALKERDFSIATLEANAPESLFNAKPHPRQIYVLGNETDGVSSAVKALSNTPLHIPMQRNVESLNVAVTASLIAYASSLTPMNCKVTTP